MSKVVRYSTTRCYGAYLAVRTDNGIQITLYTNGDRTNYYDFIAAANGLVLRKHENGTDTVLWQK